MPPKPVAKKTTPVTKGGAATKGGPATKGAATKGGAAAKGGATKGASKGAAGGAAKEPEKKEAPKPVIKKILMPEEVGLKQIASVIQYAGDVGAKFQESKRWLFIIDRNGNVGTFLKYRDVNMLQASLTTDFQEETFRKMIMGALRFGKPFVLDISGADQEGIMALAEEKINLACKGLYDDIMDRSILDHEKCSRMANASDEEEYHNRFEYRVSDFQFIVLTNVDPPSTASENFFPVIVS